MGFNEEERYAFKMLKIWLGGDRIKTKASCRKNMTSTLRHLKTKAPKSTPK